MRILRNEPQAKSGAPVSQRCRVAIGSRQSLGLSVITNERSTTKKLIVAMRLFRPSNWAIIEAINASKKYRRVDCENVWKTALIADSFPYSHDRFTCFKKPFS